MDARVCEAGELLGELSERERKNAPKHLFLQGDASLLAAGRRVSVVGTRRPSADGVRRTMAIVDALVRRRLCVVSGLAKGVDTVAHTHAMQLGGRTIAVLGNPLDVSFPPENRELQARIGREHLVVSQFASGTPHSDANFPRRNRTMALLSHATIVIEATETSGTRYQGWEALRLGRPLFLLESLVHAELQWPREMIAAGAAVLTRDNLERALESIPWRSVGELPS